MNFDERKYRQTMGLFTTGVSIITLPKKDSQVLGITINSLTSVSLDPALVLFCMKRTAQSYAELMASPKFGISILSVDQHQIAKQCTMRGGSLLENHTYDLSEWGIPVVRNCLATLECHRQDIHQGGDHSIFVAQVLSLHENAAKKDPLVFFQSEFTHLLPKEKDFKEAM